MTKSIRKYLLAAVAIGALSVGTTQGAKAAELVSSSVLNITNIIYSWDTDNDGVADQTIDLADFDNVSGNNNADASGDLDSIAGDVSDADSTAITAGGSVDISRQCEGNCAGAPAENSTAVDNTLPGPGEHYASGDSNLQGLPVDSPFGPAGSNSLTRADVSLISGDTGSATSNTGTTTTIVFDIGNNFAGSSIIVSFDYLIDIYTEMVDAAGGSSMLASVSWTAQLSGPGVFDFFHIGTLAACLSAGGTELDPGPNTCQDSGSATFVSSVLAAGTYTLTIRQTAESDATLVPIPEPGTVGAIGLGLLSIAGIGWRNRRRKDA